MILIILLLLVCQLVGEAFAAVAQVPLPGPVIGMVLLLICFRIWPDLAGKVRPVAQVILANLSLLFVPAGVGIVANIGLLRGDGPGLLAAVLVSTPLAIAAGAISFRLVARMIGAPDE